MNYAYLISTQDGRVFPIYDVPKEYEMYYSNLLRTLRIHKVIHSFVVIEVKSEKE